MEQRRVYGKTTGIMKPSQQSARWMLPLVPEAAHVEDRFYSI